jgi:hypothetical protein
MERRDENTQSYGANVTALQLLSGVVPVPPWADTLIQTIEAFTGQSAGRKWVRDSTPDVTPDYAFGGMGSPGSVVKKKKGAPMTEFPPKSWGTSKNDGSYFDSWDNEPNEVTTNEKDGSLVDATTLSPGGSRSKTIPNMTSPFDVTNADIRPSADRTKSPFDVSALKWVNEAGPSSAPGPRPKSARTGSETSLKMKAWANQLSSQLESDFSTFSKFSFPRPSSKAQSPNQDSLIQYEGALPDRGSPPQTDSNLPYHLQEVHVDLDRTNVSMPSPTLIRPAVLRKPSGKHDSDSESEEDVPRHKRAPSQRFKAALKEPLPPAGVGRAIVRFDFDAVEVLDSNRRPACANQLHSLKI